MNHERGPTILEFAVPGQPAGSGSKSPMPKGRMVGDRFIPVLDAKGRPVFYVKPSSEKTEPWMAKVIGFGRKAWGSRPPLNGAIWLDLGLYEMRPLRHYYRRKSGDVLRPDAPAYPHDTETHDYDKMRRAISDSLTQARVFHDDRRVVGGEGFKLFADLPPRQPCAVIRFGLMKAVTVADLGLPPVPGQETLDEAPAT